MRVSQPTATRTGLALWPRMEALSTRTRYFLCFCDWLLKRKKWPGEVVRAFNTTRMLDRIAARYGRKLNECSIGFKHIADLMMEREIVIGGEESGGIGYSRLSAGTGWHFEFPAAGQRDGGRRQAARAVGSRSAKRVWRALLWPPRHAHCRRCEAGRDSARQRELDTRSWAAIQY